ncbi:MAG TPA: type II secretion system protein GspG, partial [Planctomycetota bacterium]|nr:type II secretion system protein GspG [Planctomycetota bacterium]
PYRYEPDPNGITFDVTSLGKDGKPGGQEEDADLSSRSIVEERRASREAGEGHQPGSGPATRESEEKGLGETPGGLQAGLAGLVVQDLADAVIHFRIDGGRLPESLEALLAPDARGIAWLRGESPPLDPWGRMYWYRPDANGRTFTIGSDGKDGSAGGEGADADIRFSADAAVRPRKAR